MQDYTIDLHVVSGSNRATAAARASGTKSERPILCHGWSGMAPAAAAYTLVLQAMEEIRRFLVEGDTLNVRITSATGNVSNWIARGSGVAQLDARLRRETLALRNEGIGFALLPGADIDPQLSRKAEMSHMLGM